MRSIVLPSNGRAATIAFNRMGRLTPMSRPAKRTEKVYHLQGHDNARQKKRETVWEQYRRLSRPNQLVLMFYWL